MRIIQLLDWKLKSVEGVLDKIKEAGFDTIQINPMQGFKENNPYLWSLSYQPINLKIGNCFGTKADLTRLCKKANDMGISIVVDAIVNHVANYSCTKEGRLVPHGSVDKKITSIPNVFKPRRDLVGDEYNDKNLASKYLIGLPGLDLNNSTIQEMIFNYINELYKCGVKGIRIDAAKHIGMPSDGVTFFPNLKEVTDSRGMFSYSEFIGNGCDEWVEELAKYSHVLTNIQRRINDSSKKVVFVESHDTYLHDDHLKTRDKSMFSIVNTYFLLAHAYDNTLIYLRPNRYPFDSILSEKFDGWEYQDYGKLDEKQFFDMSLLSDETLKEANSLKGDKRLALVIEGRN